MRHGYDRASNSCKIRVRRPVVQGHPRHPHSAYGTMKRTSDLLPSPFPGPSPAPSASGAERPRPRWAIGRVLALGLALLILPGCSERTGDRGAPEEATTASRSSAEDGRPRVGVPLETPLEKPDFVLTDVSGGEPFHFREETRGFVTLVFVGYTHCPDVCPVHMANLAAVLPELPREVSDRIRVVFISSDPERDTPERIREWLSSFDPSFIGLRGSREEIRSVEEALGLPPSVVEEGRADGGRAGDPEDYFVGHAAQVLAFEMDDTARVGFPWGTRQRDWRRALPRLVPEGGS